MARLSQKGWYYTGAEQRLSTAAQVPEETCELGSAGVKQICALPNNIPYCVNHAYLCTTTKLAAVTEICGILSSITIVLSAADSYSLFSLGCPSLTEMDVCRSAEIELREFPHKTGLPS